MSDIVHLEVFRYDDPAARVWVPKFIDCRWDDNGEGYGEFSINYADVPWELELDDDLDQVTRWPVRWYHRVNCYIGGVHRFTWMIERRHRSRVTAGEEAGDVVTVKGRGLAVAFQHAVLQSEARADDPALHTQRLTPDDRPFTFASQLYDEASDPWAPVTTIEQVGGQPRETQTVTVNGTPTGGTFTLTYAGQTTGPIVYNATAAQVFAALEGLNNIDAGDITVTGTNPYTVTFDPDLGDVAEMTGDGSALTGGSSPSVSVSTSSSGGGDYPEGWVAEEAWWVSAAGTDDTFPEGYKEGVNYFRGTFDGGGLLEVHAACAGDAEVMIDGALTMTVSELNRTSTADVRLAEGTHQMAVRYRPRGGNRIAVAVLDRTGRSNGVVTYDTMGVTDSTWVGLPDVFPPPSFTPGRVVRLKMEEASARNTAGAGGQGVLLLDLITRDFTDTHDSNGVAWAEGVDRYWQLGTDYLSILNEIEESACEWYVTKDGVLKLYSGTMGEQKNVHLIPGKNILRMEHEQIQGRANAQYLYRFEGGWGEARRGILSTTVRREGFGEFGTVPSRTEVRRLIEASGVLYTMKVTESIVVEMTGADGCRPYEDFAVGDSVYAPSMFGNTTSVRCLSIGVESDELGNATYAPVFMAVGEDVD